MAHRFVTYAVLPRRYDGRSLGKWWAVFTRESDCITWDLRSSSLTICHLSWFLKDKQKLTKLSKSYGYFLQKTVWLKVERAVKKW